MFPLRSNSVYFICFFACEFVLFMVFQLFLELKHVQRISFLGYLIHMSPWLWQPWVPLAIKTKWYLDYFIHKFAWLCNSKILLIMTIFLFGDSWLWVIFHFIIISSKICLAISWDFLQVYSNICLRYFILMFFMNVESRNIVGFSIHWLSLLFNSN